MNMSKTEPRIIVALDFADPAKALQFVANVTPDECRLKVGKELFTRAGPHFVRDLVARGFDVFLDLKFHDIPNTVAQACAAAAELGVWMVNVHALGGEKMMRAAREAIVASGKPTRLIAVTVLTSMDEEQLRGIGLDGSIDGHVLRLAKLAKKSGLDGVVCSPREAAAIRAAIGQEFLLVTPGVRPAGVAADDQTRIATPAQALRNGSDYLVIGRPITAAADPRAALETIAMEMRAGAA
jgi:orotidine-5'-phosphate decarboxylase